VPGAIGVGAKSSARVIATGNAGHRFCPAPDLEQPRRLPRTEGNFRSSPGSRPDRGFRGSRCSGGPWSCSWRNSTCRNRRGARGLDSSRESGARRGLAGVSYTGEDARQLRRPASRQQRTATGSRKGVRPVPCDGRHLDRRHHPLALTCPGWAAIRRLELEPRSVRGRGAKTGRRKRVSEVLVDRGPVSRKSAGALRRVTRKRPAARPHERRAVVDRTEAGCAPSSASPPEAG
jgi:hypothetical protein